MDPLNNKGLVPIYKRIVIGIDQSYDRCGISIAADNKLLKVTYTNFKGCTNNIEKRKHLVNIVNKILINNSKKASECFIILERIRVFSGGRGANPTYLKATGALVAAIVDAAYEHNIKVYSVDTRAWKTQVVGSNKIAAKHEAEIKPEKMGAIEFIQKKGFDCKEYDKNGEVKKSVRGKNKGKIKYIDDMADGACIALYGFVPESKSNLLLEIN